MTKKEEKQFFFEKKNQKTFVGLGVALPPRARKGIRVFAGFLKKKRFLSCVILWAPLAGSACGAEVRVTVTHVRNAEGRILVAMCARADFLQPHCPWQGAAPAAFGSVKVTLRGVPAGRYAIEAFHDENDNQKLDRNFLGIPTEGMAFSHDAPMHFGPPDFDAAAIDVGATDVAATMSMRYY